VPDFAYIAKDRAGEELSGIVSVPSADHAIEELHKRGLVVLHVAEDRTGKGDGIPWYKRDISLIPTTTNTRDLALFTRQLSTLFEAGIPLVRGLRGLAADETNKMLSRTVKDVGTRVETGSNLSDAMAYHPRTFNKLYVSMVRAGEGSGTLEDILEHLAVYLEKMDALKTKIRSAMSYPIFVLFVAFTITLFLLLKIVPTFETIYADLNAELPLPTRMVLWVSNLIQDNILITTGIVLLIMALVLLWRRTPAGRYQWDGMMLGLPVFGPIIRKAVISRFTRTFGILLKSGLPVLETLELVKGATGNAVVEKAIMDAREEIARGREITTAFRGTKKIPEMVLQLMATGEEAGQLDSMLMKASDFYDRQVEAAVQGLSALIEPLLIVIVGAIVGVVVITMYLPIFYLGDAILHGTW
jgi:type IV pilus assembly protein PilC